MYDIDELERDWQQYWQDLAIDLHRSELIFQLLVNAYSQPHRHYHDLAHLRSVLTTISRFSSQLQNPIAVYLAAWFHDFSYDPQASTNELQSAEFASESLINIGVSQDIVDRVRVLILATKGHQIDRSDPDRCIFLDADLAIFGADPVRYQVYQQAIRREYSWVSDPAYRLGRIQVLESFLQRNRLYQTELLFSELEAIARNNINTEILLLSTALS